MNRGTWAEAFLSHPRLKALGVQPTPSNLLVVLGWIWGETGGNPKTSRALANPLDSTTPAKDATPFNDIRLGNGQVIHVWNYPGAQAGLDATVATLLNGYYPRILAELIAGNNADQAALAISQSVWGTGPGAVAGLYAVRAGPAQLAAIEVPGTEAVVPISPPALAPTTTQEVLLNVDMQITQFRNVTLDAGGHGWVLVPGAANYKCFVEWNAAQPQEVGGYPPIPTVGFSVHDTDKECVLDGGPPGGTVDFDVVALIPAAPA